MSGSTGLRSGSRALWLIPPGDLVGVMSNRNGDRLNGATHAVTEKCPHMSMMNISFSYQTKDNSRAFHVTSPGLS